MMYQVLIVKKYSMSDRVEVLSESLTPDILLARKRFERLVEEYSQEMGDSDVHEESSDNLHYFHYGGRWTASWTSIGLNELEISENLLTTLN